MRYFYYTYVLLSEKDNKFYTGYTTDLKRRFEEHSNGKVSSTKNRRPLKLIYYEACLNQTDATHREKYLKTFHGKMFIRNRLKSYLTGSMGMRDIITHHYFDLNPEIVFDVSKNEIPKLSTLLDKIIADIENIKNENTTNNIKRKK